MDDSVCDIRIAGLLFGENIKLNPCLTPYANNISKWIKG